MAADSSRGEEPPAQDELAQQSGSQDDSPAGSAMAAHGGQATNVQVNVGAPTVAIVQAKSGNPLFLRIIWFLFIGWWAGFIWAGLAWLLNLTIIGLPLGILMFNRLPAVVTLRRTEKQTTAEVEGTQITVREVSPEQYPWFVRAIFFALVGWWFSLVWILLAYGLLLTIIGMPLAFIMFDYAAAVTTLRRVK